MLTKCKKKDVHGKVLYMTNKSTFVDIPFKSYKVKGYFVDEKGTYYIKVKKAPILIRVIVLMLLFIVLGVTCYDRSSNAITVTFNSNNVAYSSGHLYLNLTTDSAEYVLVEVLKDSEILYSCNVSSDEPLVSFPISEDELNSDLYTLRVIYKDKIFLSEDSYQFTVKE